MPPIRDEWTTDDGSIRLLLGDCLEILPGLGKVDAVVTDPPYGIARDGKPPSTSSHGGHKGYEFMGWDESRPCQKMFGCILSCSDQQIVWGGNYFADMLPPSRCWLLWDKGQRIDQADGELAWTSLDMPVRVKTINRVALQSDGAVHPTQKPVALMEWCLGFIPTARTIIDPFCGSGTTGVACIRLGRRFIGIEREPKYFEIAKRRIRDELDKTRLIETPKRLVQASFLEPAACGQS